MSEYVINDMFTGKPARLPQTAFSGEPSEWFFIGWRAGMDGDPKSPPHGYLPSEAADWLEGYEAAERD